MTLVPDRHARTVLPIPDKAYAGPILYDAKNPDQIDLGDDTNDHLIDPEERLKIVMARQ